MPAFSFWLYFGLCCVFGFALEFYIAAAAAFALPIISRVKLEAGNLSKFLRGFARFLRG